MKKLEVNYQNMTMMMMLKARILKTGVVESVRRNQILGKLIQIQNQIVIHHQ